MSLDITKPTSSLFLCMREMDDDFSEYCEIWTTVIIIMDNNFMIYLYIEMLL